MGCSWSHTLLAHSEWAQEMLVWVDGWKKFPANSFSYKAHPWALPAPAFLILLNKLEDHQFSSIQLLSCVWLFEMPWTAVCQASLSITNSQSLLKLMSVELVMPSKHLILCHPLLLLPSILPSIRVFSNKSVLPIRWPKHWRFSFSISPFDEYSGLISFRMDWLDLLAVQGTPKRLLQHHSSKVSVFQCSAFFVVHTHTWLLGKTTALTFANRPLLAIISLHFNMLSRFVIAVFPRRKCLLISWLQSPSAVILEPKKVKSVILSIVSPTICHEVMGPDAMIFIFLNVEF